MFKTIRDWKFDFGQPWVNIQRAGTKLITTSADWSEFDYWGGTYYGDPNPPTCDGRWKDDGAGGCYWDGNDCGPDQCTPCSGRWKSDGAGGCYWDASDCGPDQCSPDAAAAALRLQPETVARKVKNWLARLLLFVPPNASQNSSARAGTVPHTRSGSRQAHQSQDRAQATPNALHSQRQRGIETGLARIPYVNPRSNDEVRADLIAGVQQTGLADIPGYEVLNLTSSDPQLARIERVRSLSDHPDYFLLTITMGGQPFALATLDATGWLASVALTADVAPIVITSEQDAANAIAASSGARPVSVERIFGFSNMTGSELTPLYLGRISDSDVIVTPDGHVLVRDDSTTAEGWIVLKDKSRKHFRLIR